MGSFGLHVTRVNFQKLRKNLIGIFGKYYAPFGSFFTILCKKKIDFSQIAGADLYSEQFCQQRLAEDMKVAERAVFVRPHVDKYVKIVMILGKAATLVFFFLRSVVPVMMLYFVQSGIFVSIAKPLKNFILISKYSSIDSM